MFAISFFAACSPGPDGDARSGASTDDAPAPREAAQDDASSNGKATAVFAGGCFWCTEAVFEQIDGVSDVVSGYAGGSEETANYQAVSTGQTEHAEAIRITYDPRKVSYEKLLEIHFASHDPTQVNRQGPDTGPQYRTAVFYADEQQKQIASDYIAKLNESGDYENPIATTLEPLEAFYPAEAYHQDYAANNPMSRYIRMFSEPKVEKVRKQFADDLK
jgi:peptide-methionine (S)-S-oxide reductase